MSLLHIISPFLSPHPSPHFFEQASSPPSLLFLFFRSKNSFSKRCKLLIKASSLPNGSENTVNNVLMNDQVLLSRVAGVKDANEALEVIGEMSERSFGVVSNDDCCSIISAAIERNNVDLALSVFYAMRSSFDQGVGDNSKLVDRWRWSRPDVGTFRLLVQGLASSLRVSDALKIISSVCRIGVSPGEEVPFGKIVKCPSCMIAAAVAQPQHGIQLVSCSKCRYQYELVSGDIVSIESEEISMEVPAWKRGLRLLKLKKQSIPAAVHSIVVETPSRLARTHRFATETVELPAQEGERVTIAVATPSNVYRDVGPLRFRSKVPGFKPGEPMCLTNHKTGRESILLRAPLKDQISPSLNPYILFPLLAALASGDAASRIIDSSLPQIISVAVIASVAVGSTYQSLVLPQINRLPQRMVDVIAIRQQLLSQYYTLQSRIKDLREAAEKEVWMLARMCQLENKIVAVGEPSYNARKSKVKRVREGLENSLSGRIELIDSYARISSMIEIEIEMDSDVLVAEVASNVESVAEQIQQIMEIENLEERWRLQAEANDEVERLLSSQPVPMEPI